MKPGFFVKTTGEDVQGRYIRKFGRKGDGLMEDQLYEFLRENREVQRFFMSLPEPLQNAMSGVGSVTPQEKPYVNYINLLLEP